MSAPMGSDQAGAANLKYLLIATEIFQKWRNSRNNGLTSSGESRKFFLPVLCMPEAHNSGGSKIIFLWLLIKRGKWVLDIHLSSHEILNALIILNTLNFNEL